MRDVTALESVDVTLELNAIIEDYFGRNAAKAEKISPYYGQLWQEMNRLVRSGGKRLRPKMTLLAYRAFGGTDVKAILPIAAAQELLHLSMLIHDDIIDRDYVRYGVDNIAGSYDKLYESLVSDKTDRLHYAHSAALLAGDLLISGAYQLTLESPVDPAKIIEIQKIFGRSLFEVAGGELIDTESAFRELGAIKAETVALYKTASYTFIGPLAVGALLAGASVEDRTLLRLFAKNIGIAFQLRDDIIGIFGDEQQTGKTTIGDIREGKRTYLVEQFYERATPDDIESFNRYFGDHSIVQQDAQIVKDLLIKSGALQKTEEVINAYETKARSALDGITINPELETQLEDLIRIATRRQQ